MKEENRAGRTSTMKRLGHEISKLGLRMRNRTPTNSESELRCSTDELADKGINYCVVSETAYSKESVGNSAAEGSETTALKQRRHSRNEFDEDVEFKERNNSIKNSLRPILTRKSRSDLAKYPRRNEIPCKQDTSRIDSSENINNRQFKIDARDARKAKEAEKDSVTYRVATKTQVDEHVHKKPSRASHRPKRSKSFSVLLSWRHGHKHAQKDKTEKESCKSRECSSRYLKRSNSFSGQVEGKRCEELVDSRTCKQYYYTPQFGKDGTQIGPEISVTINTNGNGFLPANNSGFIDEMRKSCEWNPFQPRLSYMANQGFRYNEGMIETDLCSTEL